MNFAQIKTNIGINLNDAGKVYYTDIDLNASLQEAYRDIVCLSQCIIKKVTLDWQNDLTYYNFKDDFSISDFLAVTAVFNNVNNRWLQDDLVLSNFDKLRTNWETWHGTPNWWAFSALNRTAIIPKQELATGTFDLYYWATAPAISDGSSPLVATDVQKLFEMYSTANLLEQAEEYVKAQIWWTPYFAELEVYIERTKSLAKTDFRLLI